MIVVTVLLSSFLSPASTPQESYRLPPQAVVDLVDAPATPSIRVSPDARWMLVVERGGLPSIEDVARPWLPLAGMRIDIAANAAYRTGHDTGLLVRDLEGEHETRVPLGEGGGLIGAGWSHTSRAFAFTLRTEVGVELWVAQVDAPDAPVRVTERLNAVFGSGYRWMPDGARLLVHLVPSGRGEPPARPDVPEGPVTQETSGEESPLRTYQDLLRDEHDSRLFEYYTRTQLAVWNPADGALAPVGRPGMIISAVPAPDGERLLVTELHRPFSYVMPYSRFPRRIEVRDLDGGTQYLIADVPLGENIPLGGVRSGPRSVQWKSGEAATVAWVEALDGGDPKAEVSHRDRWLALAAPFEGAAVQLVMLAERASGVSWMRDLQEAVFGEYDRDRRWTRKTLVHLTDPEVEPRLLEDRSVRDRYSDPGALVRQPDSRGSSVVRQAGPWVYRTGTGSMDGGARPFLHRLNLDSLETQELWRCAPGSYEFVVALVRAGTEDPPSFVTRYESPAEPPNWRMRDLADPAGGVRALTEYPDPQPALRGVKKKLIIYTRSDGVPLSATLYLPKGYEEGTRLPLFIWAYPLEFSDPATAGQVSGTPFRFTRFAGSSHLFLLTRGYAVLDNAAMPVIGDPETMNDTFIEQIAMAAEAAIAAVAELGVSDPARVAVGGHSYGAFMTANLLAHTDLFRAGIARSGAYNRTLTPFGFQAERRTLWEATDAYVAISPFLHADGIDEPLLLIHGAVDNNSGTFPIQSERLYKAIKGLGGTTRYVVLPHESHGYRARESVLHTLAEMIDWLDRHMATGGVLEAGSSTEGRPEEATSGGED